MDLKTRLQWLRAASLVVIVVGLSFFAALLVSPLATAVVLWLDLVVWPIDGTQTLAGADTRLLLAISGGLMVGWGTLLSRLTDEVYASQPAVGRRLIAWSIGSWFVVDGVGSLLVGAALNVPLNLGFLLLFAIPLALPERPPS